MHSLVNLFFFLCSQTRFTVSLGLVAVSVISESTCQVKSTQLNEHKYGTGTTFTMSLGLVATSVLSKSIEHKCGTDTTFTVSLGLVAISLLSNLTHQAKKVLSRVMHSCSLIPTSIASCHLARSWEGYSAGALVMARPRATVKAKPATHTPQS